MDRVLGPVAGAGPTGSPRSHIPGPPASAEEDFLTSSKGRTCYSLNFFRTLAHRRTLSLSE